MSSSQESHAEPNNKTNVEQPPAASTEIPSNDQQQSDAHAETRPESPHKTSKRKSHKKPKKKAAKKKGALPTHLQVIRDEIDSLKAQLNQAEAIAAKEEQERTDDERAILEKKDATSASVEHLEELFAKLNTPEMIQRSQQPQVSKRGLTEEQTITMLHFFYLVRLSQQGFFSLIANAYPGVQVEAVAYLCDKIVGNSLFPSTEASADVRRAKTKEVFDLLRKLHQGVDEPIGENFTMTYKAMRDMIHNLIDKALKQQPPQTNGSLQRSEESLSLQDQHQQQQQQPVWVVVPFTSMMDLSSLQLPSSAVASSSQNETADSSKEVTASSPVSESIKDNTDDVEGEVASEQSTEVTEEDGSSEVDGFHSRNRGRGRGRGYNNRGFNRGRGRGDGARGGGSFRRGSNYRGRGFFRGPGRGVSWSPPSTSQ